MNEIYGLGNPNKKCPSYSLLEYLMRKTTQQKTTLHINRCNHSDESYLIKGMKIPFTHLLMNDSRLQHIVTSAINLIYSMNTWVNTNLISTLRNTISVSFPVFSTSRKCIITPWKHYAPTVKSLPNAAINIHRKLVEWSSKSKSLKHPVFSTVTLAETTQR